MKFIKDLRSEEWITPPEVFGVPVKIRFSETYSPEEEQRRAEEAALDHRGGACDVGAVDHRAMVDGYYAASSSVARPTSTGLFSGSPLHSSQPPS